MDTGTIIWIVIAILVVAALVGLFLAMKRRREAKRREHATEIRHEAAAAAPDIRESELHAQEAEARAERARLQAESADQDAARARQGVDAERAEFEDRVRTADRVDPTVNHRSSDYQPDTTPADEAVQPAAGTRAAHPDAAGTPGHPTTTDQTTTDQTTPGQTATTDETTGGTSRTTDPGGRHSS